MNFQIKDIYKERSIVGNTIITAKCLDDDSIITIRVSNKESQDKILIKELLVAEHKKYKKYKASSISIGDII